MENYEYNKIFPPNIEEGEDDVSPDEAKRMIEFIHSMEKDKKENPRFLIPSAPMIFERMVSDCEQIVKEFGGRLKAEIDYSSYSATIEMWCCYVEFERGEFMNTLQEISRYAMSVRFEPLITGEQHVFILMPYFIALRDFEEDD